MSATTITTIPADWDVTDASTWGFEATVDAHLGYHHTGMVVRELQEVSYYAKDQGLWDSALPVDADAAEWWAGVLKPQFDAAVAMAEASPEADARACEILGVDDLSEYLFDSDDYEWAAIHAGEIVDALADAAND